MDPCGKAFGQHSTVPSPPALRAKAHPPHFKVSVKAAHKPIAPSSPWQNGLAERMIGSIRRECVDHVVVLGEAHLRRILTNIPPTTTS